MPRAGGRDFNTEETMNAKALGWACIWGFQKAEQKGQSLGSEEQIVEEFRTQGPKRSRAVHQD